jgi:hypothetical protein
MRAGCGRISVANEAGVCFGMGLQPWRWRAGFVFWAIRQLTVLGIIKLISARGDECRLSALHGERHLNEQHDGG